MAEHQATKKDARTLQIEARKKHMKDLSKPAAHVRVTPGNDDMRRVLKHPNGVGFPESGSVEWPQDQFTRRRVKDGSVKIEEQRHDERDDKTRKAEPRKAEPAV